MNNDFGEQDRGSFFDRLVTVNLLASACKALRGGSIRTSNLRDLCTLINLVVLHEELFTIGDATAKPHLARVFEQVADLTGVDPKIRDHESLLDEETVRLALPVASVFYSTTEDELRRDLEAAVRRDLLLADADYPEDLIEGAKAAQARTGPVSAARSFFYRSFLYLGHSAASGTPLVLDAVRASGLKRKTVRVGARFDSDELSRGLQERLHVLHDPVVRKLTRRSDLKIPPIAAVAFKRAQGDVTQLPKRVRELRDELREVRLDLIRLGGVLAGATVDKDSGLQRISDPDLVEAKEQAIARFTTGLEKLRPVAGGLPACLIRLIPAKEFAMGVYELCESAFGMVTHPDHHVLGLLKTGVKVFKLSESVEELDRRYFSEAHLLDWDLRRWFNSGIDLRKLFGDIVADSPAD